MGTSSSKQAKQRQADWPWVWAMRDPEILDWKKGLSLSEIQDQALKQQDLPVPITDHLYLGNANSVEDIEHLKRLGVTAVLNMAGPLAVRKNTIELYQQHGIVYKGINAVDEYEYPLLQKHWKEARAFITASVGSSVKGPESGICVVNCVAGMNRSGLIVAAYYMLSTQTPVLETVRHIRTQRGNVALQNEGFQEQLVALARQHGLLDKEPGTPQALIAQLPPSWQPENDWRVASRKPKWQNPMDRLSWNS